MEEWTKIDKSRYDGTCAGCGNKYLKDTPIYVCGNKYFDSVRCVQLVFTGAVEKVKEGSKREDTTQGSSSSSQTSTPLVQCQNCGDMVAHVTHIISIGGRDIDISICDRCEWLRRAAWQLKLNGMWKPTPKNEPLREVKP